MANEVRFKPPDIDVINSVFMLLDKCPNGKPENSTANFLKVLENDDHFSEAMFDEFSDRPVRITGNVWDPWSDTDDSESRHYIETWYHIRSTSKLTDAFNILLSHRHRNRLQERIKSIKWDGIPRCQFFLIRWLKADDTAYVRECSRLIFAQGIKRAFEPGCKAEIVIVLKGDQGCGKSTIVMWLALNPEFYSAVSSFIGQEGAEAVQGKWVCEIEEMLATIANDKYSSKAEAMAKSYISTQSAFYRNPYAHRPTEHPRTNIFIGTTNKDRFLTDLTGNRRWYPVDCHSDAYELYENEESIKNYIEQCWAEMYDAYTRKDPLSSVTAGEAVRHIIIEKQHDSEMEDPRVGLIERYLTESAAEYVSCQEIWTRALHPDVHDKASCTRRDANEIGEILRLKLGCQPVGKKYFPEFGTQHCYKVPDSLTTATLSSSM